MQNFTRKLNEILPIRFVTSDGGHYKIFKNTTMSEEKLCTVFQRQINVYDIHSDYFIMQNFTKKKRK